MAIALVDSGKGTADAPTTTIDITNVTVSGSNTVMYVVIVQASNTGSPNAAVVVWDSAGANENFETIDATNPIGTVVNPARGMCLFRLKNPTAGVDKTLSISNLNAALNEAAFVLVLSGVDQTTPNGTVDSVEQPGADVTLASSSIASDAGDWVFSFASTGDSIPNFAVSGGNLVLRDTSILGNAGIGWADDRVGGTVTATWTFDSASNVGLLSFNVNAAAGGAPALVNKDRVPSRPFNMQSGRR